MLKVQELQLMYFWGFVPEEDCRFPDMVVSAL